MSLISVLLTVSMLGASDVVNVDEELGVPIRPGIPGQVPFWNGSAGRFIYAPAFDFSDVENARIYRFTVRSLTRDESQVFYAPVPFAPLSPVWEDVPFGVAELTVEGMDMPGGSVLGEAGKRLLLRAAPFSEFGSVEPRDYEAAGKRGLDAVFQQSFVQHWLKGEGPDPAYTFYCYPSKIFGALTMGMVAYSRVTDDPKAAEQALAIAREASDSLIDMSLPAAAPYAYFPPTYWVGVDDPKGPAKHYKDLLMTIYGSDAAFGYLDLYGVTGDGKYLEAAKHIADTYVHTQGADGTWPLHVSIDTGEAKNDKRMVPTWVMTLFERLEREHGCTQYREACQRAFEWTMANPMITFAWNGQFEDVGSHHPDYRDLSREQACDMAMRLLDRVDGNPGYMTLAKELIRFSEDQFVVWADHPEATEEIKPEEFITYTPNGQFLPCVLEQYFCYVGVARSSFIMINTFLKAYEVTGDKTYLRKAQALGNGLMDAQDAYGTGTVPTFMRRQKPNEGKQWLNNSIYGALALLNLSKIGE